MAPDLNSLPPSTRNVNMTTNGESNAAPGGESPTASPRAGSISLQAAATMNAGLQHEPSRRSSSSSLSRHRQSPHAGRRRSVIMNLQLNDPSVPGPGEMVSEGHGIMGSGGHSAISPQPLSASPLLTGGDPHHNRTPSLGELHQELEAEQEAQVNRLLQMIRQQQQQLQQLQAAQGQSQTSVAAEDAPPTPERSNSTVNQSSGLPSTLPHPPVSSSMPRSPVLPQPRSSFDRRSRTPSRGASSPRTRTTSIGGESGEQWVLGGRDESAFYQAETQSLVRENQMLRHRIRELERQLNEAHANASVTREPAQPSHLLHSTSVSDEKPEEAGVGTGSSSVPQVSASAVPVPKEE